MTQRELLRRRQLHDAWRADPVLASILRTVQRGLDTTATIVAALQAPRPIVLDALR